MPSPMDARAPAGSSKLTVSYERLLDGSLDCWWQLTARNGRLLGRSASRFTDQSAAIADFRDIAGRVDGMTLVVLHADGRTGWAWRIDEGRNNAVMRSLRTYDRYDSCRRSGNRVLEALMCLG